MIWAVLGEIEFEQLNHPSAQSERTTADYAEHALLQGKPKLQWVGEGLDGLSLELAFHAALVDPDVEIRKLKTAKAAHDPLPYVLGSGDYRGIYVITALDVTTRKTDANGRLLSAVVSLELLEYTGKYTKPLPRPLALRNNLAATNSPSQPFERVLASSPPLVTAAQKTLALARKGGSLISAGMDAYQLAKGLRENPLALLGQVPRLLGLTSEALPSLAGLQTSAQLLADGADLVQLGASAGGDLQQAISALNSADLDGVVGQFDYAATRIELAATRMSTSAPRFAGLAADIITRRA